ncbi:hypothetical protein M405DRAFT_844472 [Rhizopogon salebrosus TDB-379]|nr:hypothetical protein M405DRAFT_844472 [Rhizopogon salebrosus TDB-379]
MSDSSSLPGSEVTADDGPDTLSNIPPKDAMVGDAAIVEYSLTPKHKDPHYHGCIPSRVKLIAPPREDLYNYFYQSRQEVVLINSSTTFIDPLCFAIGDKQIAAVSRLKYLKVVLAEVRDVLALNLSGEALKEKAKDMGCTDALELNKTDEDPRL